MDPVDAKAALVRQYELLLVARHRFLLADVIASLDTVARMLQHAELLLLRALQGRDTSDSPALPRQSQRNSEFRSVVESMHAQLKQVTAQFPVFLGDMELNSFVRVLQEFTRSAGVDLFENLSLGADEQELVEKLAKDVIQEVECELETLEQVVVRTLPVATMLQKKRKHLVQLVDASLAIVDRAQSSRTMHYEEKKAQLIVEFKTALKDPSLRAANQIEHEILRIEKSIKMLLVPHLEICRPISVANARVTQDAGFKEKDCVDVSTFVDITLQLADSTEALSSLLNDADSYLRQLRLFEKAARKDAFVVCSSALKLNFHESLDEELFLAYVADWQGAKDRQKEVLASSDYNDASQQILKLKEEIMSMQVSIQGSRKQAALDEPSKAKLVTQIADVFHEAGGDTSRMIQIFT